MRIDLNPGSGVERAQSQTTELQRSSGVAEKGANAEPTSAEFETGVGKLTDVALRAPEVRQAKVQELKARFETGTYHVSDRSIALAVLDQLRVRS
jgi:anti-sigma28 factor (negative regulator of flagellin synthesis)